MSTKIIVGLFNNGEYSHTTEVTPENPLQHNKYIASVYARVRVDNKRIGTRFIPDVNMDSGIMYKAFDFGSGELVPVCNSRVLERMLYETALN